MEGNILLSIVIPAYNVERYIGQCLDSIYYQGKDEKLFEVIVVDDGSNDRTGLIVRTFLENHKNAKYLRQENQGQSVARNKGFSLAKGKFVWFIDSDDWLKKGAFNSVWTLMESYKYDIIAMPLEWSFKISKKNFLDIIINGDVELEGIDYMKNKFPVAPIQRCIISKEFIDKNNITWFPHVLHEDGLYGHEIFYLAKSVHVLKNSYYNYRQQDESTMHSIKIQSAWDLITIHKQLMIFSKDHVNSSDRLWFKTYSSNILIDCLSFTWSLRHTKEYKEFINSTRNYRMIQCLECIKGNSLKNKIKLIIKAFSPSLYVRLTKIVSKIKGNE